VTNKYLDVVSRKQTFPLSHPFLMTIKFKQVGFCFRNRIHTENNCENVMTWKRQRFIILQGHKIEEIIELILQDGHAWLKL